MKSLILVLICFSPISLYALTISGNVLSGASCGPKVMVWFSLDRDNIQDRLLLMHTEVPVGGTYQFFTRPGRYQIRASDESGCEFFSKIEVSNESVVQNIKMVKK